MRKAFVNSTYRSRATWYVILMSVIIVANANTLVPNPGTGGFWSFVGLLPFLGLIATIFAFVDKSVLVAMENDFFHRNTFYWRRLRWPLGVTLVVSFASAAAAFSFALPSDATDAPTLVLIAYFVAFIYPIILSYSTAVLITAARRTSDRILKRSIFLFGLAMATFVLSILSGSIFPNGSVGSLIVNQGPNIAGTYLVYRSALSLSPVGHIQKKV